MDEQEEQGGKPLGEPTTIFPFWLARRGKQRQALCLPHIWGAPDAGRVKSVLLFSP